MKQKKAQGIAMETWTVLILVCLVIIILGALYVKFVLGAGTFFSTAGCKNSNIQNAFIKGNTGIVSQNWQTPIDCPTYDITFYETKVVQSMVKDGNEKTRDYPVKVNGVTTTKLKHLDNEAVNYVIAEELASCWNKFLEGKQSVLLDNFPWENDFGDNNEACFICDNIRFDTASVTQDEFSGFYNYLKYALYDAGDTKKTYYDYVINSSRQCYFMDDVLASYNAQTSFSEQFINELNSIYGTKFVNGQQYTLADLPQDACWNFYIDGVKSAHGWDHPGIVKDIHFSKTQTYSIIFVRMGDDKKSATYFSYIIPSSQLNNNCNQLAI